MLEAGISNLEIISAHRCARLNSGFSTQRVKLTLRKKVEKSIAINSAFDNFTAPRRPKGRLDSMFANR
jgi:hypothetical protein